MAAADRLRIALSGSYGGMNLGDEAILQSIIQQLRSLGPVEITVFTHDPDDTRRRHDVDRTTPIYELTRQEARLEIERLDLLVLGGGGILYDSEIEKLLREVGIAQHFRIPVVVWAVGAGPLTQENKRRQVAEALNEAAIITVRDRGAARLLEDIGVQREIRLTADPALLLEAEPLPADALIREGLDAPHGWVGVSVREPGPAAPDIDVEHYHHLLSNTADYMVERYDVGVVFVPMERMQQDMQQSHAVVARMQHAQRATVLKGDYTPGQIRSLMQRFEFVVGMRLHFLILAALEGVPFVALPYASKVTGLLEELEIPMPPLKKVTIGRLIAHLDSAWDFRERLRSQIAEKLPALQVRARETSRLVADLMSDIGRRKQAKAV